MSGEAQSISTQISGGSFRGSTVKQPLTFVKISEWIRVQGLDEYTTEGLIELAARYPTQALPSFRKNFNLMIARVRQKRQQEQRGELNNGADISGLKQFEDEPEQLTDNDGTPIIEV